VSDSEEVAYTLGRLQAEFEDLAVGGLRAAGPERIGALKALGGELEGMGAAHLAGRLQSLVHAIRNDGRESAACLMLAQASVRVFERLVTVEHCAAQLRLSGLAATKEDADDDGDALDGEEA
jgi:hypothetical protein